MKRMLASIFLLAAITSDAAGQQPLKFITYNILQGMRKDSMEGKPTFVNWVRKMNPDVLALQELTGFNQQTLESLAISYGHPYAVLLVEGEKYPVAITSKYPITSVRRIIDNMDRGFILSRIGGYQVAVVHLTPFDYRKRRQEVALLLEEIKDDTKLKTVILGDFNSVSPEDEVAYRDGRLVAAYKRYENRYAPILKLYKGKLDFQVIQSVLQNGYKDALKLKHKEFLKTVHPKAFQPKEGIDISSRIDFIFVSYDLVSQIRSATVIKDSFTDQYSDHYPVFMELEP